MNKLEYLKTVITATELYKSKNWYISAFAILIPDDTDKWKSNSIQYSLVLTSSGLKYVDLSPEGSVLKDITGYTPNTSLFTFNDQIDIDSTWLSSVSSAITTTVGRLVVNKFVLESVVGKKVPYINSKIKSRTIEDILVAKVKDNPVKEDDISVDEMLEIVDRCYFLSNLSDIVNLAATEKNVTKAKGIDKLRSDLIKEYEGQLHDKTKVIELESKLKKFDSEYLKDDAATEVIMSKKAVNARRKMFLMFGEDKGFEDTLGAHPNLQPLEQGLSTDPAEFSSAVNGVRFGSFARGNLTALSGTLTKTMLRSLGSTTISPEDCKTTRGYTRIITQSDAELLIGRHVKAGNKWVLVDTLDDANTYVGKLVEIRSPMYCKAPNNSLCCYCTNMSFKDQPDAIFNLSTDITSRMTTMFMKLMHDASMSTTTLNLDDMFD